MKTTTVCRRQRYTTSLLRRGLGRGDEGVCRSLGTILHVVRAQKYFTGEETVKSVGVVRGNTILIGRITPTTPLPLYTLFKQVRVCRRNKVVKTPYARRVMQF